MPFRTLTSPSTEGSSMYREQWEDTKESSSTNTWVGLEGGETHQPLDTQNNNNNNYQLLPAKHSL